METTIWELKKFLIVYGAVRFMVFWACFVGFLLLWALLAEFSPGTALAVLKVASPLTDLLKDVFFGFLPDDIQQLRKTGQFFTKLGRGVAKVALNERGQLVTQVAFNGVVILSVAAHAARWALMVPIRRRMLWKLATRQSREEPYF